MTHYHHNHHGKKHKMHGHKLDHKAAHQACAAQAKDHDAHKKCLHAHHLKTAPAHAHESLTHAFEACHLEKDLGKHQACLDTYHQ